MKFPNAAKGVKKIFNSEIIALIAALEISCFSLLKIKLL